MEITWLGHAAFLITSSAGVKILTDPYQAGGYGGAVGYGRIEEQVDVVVVSHDHHEDHNAIGDLPGSPEVVKGAGTHTAGGFTFVGMPTFHDKSRGTERGNNTVFTFEMDGMRVCHLGDLGHILTDEQAERIGQADVLFIPVGGFFTIDAQEATEVADKISPRLIIPMHYKTEVLGLPIAPVDNFLRGKENVERVTGPEFSITREELPSETRIVVLEHKL